MKRLRFRLEAAAFRLLLLVARAFPRRVLLTAGSLAGFVGYVIDFRHRRIAMDNLASAFGPDLGVRRARRIARAC